MESSDNMRILKTFFGNKFPNLVQMVVGEDDAMLQLK
jgi:hypothetical protein